MFYGKTANAKINRIQKGALRRLYNDFSSNLPILLTKSGQKNGSFAKSSKFARRGLQISPSNEPRILCGIFFAGKKPNCNLRSKDLLQISRFQTITYGASSIAYRSSHLWNSIPDEVQSCDSVLSFKRQIRELSGITCTGRAELVDRLAMYVKSRIYCN